MEAAGCKASHEPDVDAQLIAEIELQAYIAREGEKQPRRVVKLLLEVGRLSAADEEVAAKSEFQSDEIQWSAIDV